MIVNSFSFLEKLNSKTEEMIWRQGIRNWDDFISAESIKGMSPKRKGFYDRFLRKAKLNLEHRNEAFFYERIPLRETWRLYDRFKDKAVYLDIETSSYNQITMVGLYDGLTPRVLVRGHNLDKWLLQKALEECKMLVTFNGACFDIPVVNKYFSKVIPEVPHLDLRFACFQLGLTGGLKKIEKEIGIKRAEEVGDMQGGDAVILWDMWKSTGDERYIQKLIDYNKEDIINLKPLAEHAVAKLKQRQQERFETMSLTEK